VAWTLDYGPAGILMRLMWPRVGILVACNLGGLVSQCGISVWPDISVWSASQGSCCGREPGSRCSWYLSMAWHLSMARCPESRTRWLCHTLKCMLQRYCVDPGWPTATRDLTGARPGKPDVLRLYRIRCAERILSFGMQKTPQIAHTLVDFTLWF
jgi:hypothetical protein